ncbi:hypothetical protein EVAR_36528_1 [Eumeta japonica]|uniref:Uncharacterized protein n=1 Tax=Eumeta variegata TaxID=151549 RepID=A0A4C1X9B0_EUMVA|nr:hypothetical protein EVAR_36528_1 [Eumeta japonica]
MTLTHDSKDGYSATAIEIGAKSESALDQDKIKNEERQRIVSGIGFERGMESRIESATGTEIENGARSKRNKGTGLK